MTAQQLYNALEPHATSLEQLILAFTDGAGFKANSTISLRGWTNLTKLALPAAFLVSSKGAGDPTPLHELLPPHLQQLQLQYPVGNRPGSRHHAWTSKPALILHRLEQLAENKHAFLPNLILVIVWRQGWDQHRDVAAGEYEDGSSVVAQVDMLQGLFGSVGAVFELCVGEAFAETRVGGLVGVKGRGAERGGDVSAFTLDREGEGRVGLYFDGNTGGVF